jgi:hypothetical protein
MNRLSFAARLAAPIVLRGVGGVALLGLGAAGVVLAGSPWAGIVIAVGLLILIDAVLVLRHVPAVIESIEAAIAHPDPEMMAAITEARARAHAAKATVDAAAALIAAGDDDAAAALTERAQEALVEGKIAAGRAARLVARERARVDANVRARLGLE